MDGVWECTVARINEDFIAPLQNDVKSTVILERSDSGVIESPDYWGGPAVPG